MRKLSVLLFFTALTAVITWPLALHLDNFIIDRFDGLLITWFLNWDIHCLTGGLQVLTHCYDANIFYPYHNTLTFSETMFPQALIALPFVFLTNEPLVAYNVIFLLGFILTGFTTYLLVLKLTGRHSISLLSAVLLDFSIIHLNYMGHLQLFSLWPLILAILSLVNRNYKSFVLLFVVASLTTALNLYFLFSIFLIAWWMYPSERKKLFWANASGALLSLPFLVPLYLVSKQFNYVRPINDAIHFSLQIPQLLNVSSASRLHDFVPPISAGTPAFLGVVFVALILAMAFGLFKKIMVPKVNQADFKFFLVIASMAFVLALGPALHIFENTIRVGPLPAIPMPYAIFYYLLPGFSGFRTPSRWIILAAVALVMALAIFLKDRLRPKMILALIVLVLTEINFPFKYYQVPSRDQFPPEQVWLKDNYRGQPIVQFPIYNWDDRPEFGQETLREYYSTIHWHPMYNGYSGFSPKEWESRVKWLQGEFPSTESISYLRGLKVKLILTPKSWENRMRMFGNLKVAARFPETIIYEIK